MRLAVLVFSLLVYVGSVYLSMSLNRILTVYVFL